MFLCCLRQYALGVESGEASSPRALRALDSKERTPPSHTHTHVHFKTRETLWWADEGVPWLSLGLYAISPNVVLVCLLGSTSLPPTLADQPWS